jgi:hypothetical protein
VTKVPPHCYCTAQHSTLCCIKNGSHPRSREPSPPFLPLSSSTPLTLISSTLTHPLPLVLIILLISCPTSYRLFAIPTSSLLLPFASLSSRHSAFSPSHRTLLTSELASKNPRLIAYTTDSSHVIRHPAHHQAIDSYHRITPHVFSTTRIRAKEA